MLKRLLLGSALLAVAVLAAKAQISDALSAASVIGKQIEVFHASTGGDIDLVFTRLAQKSVDALLVGPAVLFNIRRVQLVTLATYHRCLRSTRCVRLPKPVA